MSNKYSKFLYLLPIAVLIASVLFFSRLTQEIQSNLINEKFEEKKLEVGMMANNVNQFLQQDKDWDTEHEYYRQTLVFDMEALDRAYMTFAVVYDSQLNKLSKQDNYNGGFDPMVYPDFVANVNNNEMGDMIIPYKPTDPAEGAPRDVYLHYEWIPTGSGYESRFLAVVAISKLTVVTKTSDWIQAGSFALVSITGLLNFVMVFMVLRLEKRVGSK